MTGGKLVRDLVPGIIRDAGKRPEVRYLSGKELLPALAAKLVEEAEEAASAVDTREGLLVELADVTEVMSALMAHHGITRQEVADAVHEKATRRGQFEAGAFLTAVRDDIRHRHYVAAQITSIVWDLVRDSADTVANDLWSRPEFVERAGDREGGCHRLAGEVYAQGFDDIAAVLNEHGLSDYLDEVHAVVMDILAETYLGNLREQDDEAAPAMAEDIRESVVGIAEGLEEVLQLLFDADDKPVVRFPGADSRRRGATWKPASADGAESLAGKAARVASGAWRAVGSLFR